MRITEITNEDRKIIKEMESLYINYSVNDSFEVRNQLSRLIEKNELSNDFDVRKQAQVYNIKLQDDLIRILKK
jgi:hypothetical protein